MQTCPKCGYTRQPMDFNKPEWSCPACGIVYAKYRPPVARGPRPAAPLPPAQPAAAEDPVAPVTQRWGRVFEGAIIAVVLAWVVVWFAGVANLRYFMAITLAFPWIALALVLRRPDIFTFRFRDDENKDTLKLASVMPLLLISGLLLAFGAGGIWELEDVWPAVLLGVAAGLAMTGLFAALCPPLRSSWPLAGAFWAQAACYTAGAAIFLNGVLDRTDGTVYPLRVLQKHVSEGGRSGTSYYVRTSSPDGDGWTDLRVDRATHDRFKRGDLMCMVRHPGRFGMRWYWKRDCAPEEVTAYVSLRTGVLKQLAVEYAMEIHETNALQSGDRRAILRQLEEQLAALSGTEDEDYVRMQVRVAYRKLGFTLAPEARE